MDQVHSIHHRAKGSAHSTIFHENEEFEKFWSRAPILFVVLD